MPAAESALLQSWHHNASAWIDAVRSASIESRRQVTDQAILLVVLGRQPERVLDLGCGEGWLLRELTKRGIEAVGVDGDRTLVEAARAAGSAPVHLASYQALAESRVDIGNQYPLICANFALLHQDIIPLLAALHALLATGGVLVIQTLHPWTAAAGEYQDGWREETFAGFRGMATDALVHAHLVQLAQRLGHGGFPAERPAGTAAPTESGAAVAAVDCPAPGLKSPRRLNRFSGFGQRHVLCRVSSDHFSQSRCYAHFTCRGQCAGWIEEWLMADSSKK